MLFYPQKTGIRSSIHGRSCEGLQQNRREKPFNSQKIGRKPYIHRRLKKFLRFIESKIGVSVYRRPRGLKFIEGFDLQRTDRWPSSHRRLKKCLPSMKGRKNLQKTRRSYSLTATSWKSLLFQENLEKVFHPQKTQKKKKENGSFSEDLTMPMEGIVKVELDRLSIPWKKVFDSQKVGQGFLFIEGGVLKFIEGFYLQRTVRWTSSHRRNMKCLPSMKDRKICLSIEDWQKLFSH